ncbi:MAG: O-antigen ligase family protein, partial [Gemmatimonadales bacterium]
MTTRRTSAARARPGVQTDQVQDPVLQRLSNVLHDPAIGTQPAAHRRLTSRWSPVSGSGALWVTAGLFGIYLAYAVLRVQEIYPDLAVTRLPMIMSLIISFVVLASTPVEGWKTIWTMLPPVRWQILIVALAVVTAPLGIWMGGSINFLVTRYSISLIVFFASIVLLRDRRAMTAALWMLLLAGAVVAAYTLSGNAKTVGRGVGARAEVGVTLDPNDLAQLFVALVPLALYMAQRKGARSVLWLVVAGMLVAAIIPTQSRGAIVGIGAVALVLLSFGTSRWRRVINILGVVLGGIGFYLAAQGSTHLDDFSDYSGGEGRIAIWKRGIV